jgi:hypothetical protein
MYCSLLVEKLYNVHYITNLKYEYIDSAVT